MPSLQLFLPGDIIMAKEEVFFCDDTHHKVGDNIVVTKETMAYYNVWYHIYDKLQTREVLDANV